MSDDEDPVVREIDIFNASELATRSMLMQFPLIPRAGPMPQIEATTYDPMADQYHFMMSRNTDSYTMADTHMSLLKTTKVPFTQPLAVGVLVDNQLHLTPISSVYQARPVAVVSSDDKVEIPGTAISTLPLTDLKPLISASGDLIADVNMTPALYQDKLKQAKTDGNLGFIGNIDEKNIKFRPPKDQFLWYFNNFQSINFDDLLKKCNLTPYSEDLLELALQHGYFVQGRWVLKPEEIPEDKLPAQFRIARRFIIVLFAHGIILNDDMLKEFMKIFGIPKPALKIIFDNLGVWQSQTRTGQFKWKHNPLFQNIHPEAAAKGEAEISKLKDAICLTCHDNTVFDSFIQPKK